MWRGSLKLLKPHIELQNFSGKTARTVRQDFHAKVFLMTLCAAYAHPIEKKVTREDRAARDGGHDQKINRTHALATLMDRLVPTFDLVVEDTGEIIRPGRIHGKRDRRYHIS